MGMGEIKWFLLIIFCVMSAGTVAAEDPARPFKKISDAQKAALKADAEKAASRTEGKGKKAKKYTVPFAVVPHVKKGPAIDGDLDDLYKDAAQFTLQRNAGAGDIAKKYPAKVFVLTDPGYLYITYQCREPSLDPASYMKEELHKFDFQARFNRMSRIKERDQAMWDDHTWEDAYHEFLLQPGATRKHGDYYHIIVNTLGTLYDAFEVDEINWDPETKVKTKLGKKGLYLIEMAIPLNSLVPAGKKFPKLWGVNFFRFRHHVGEMSWSRSWKTHMPDRFGVLAFTLGLIEEAD